jgi:NADH-quinone oxidoreductase subunit L
MNFLDLIWIIPLFPLVGFAINGLFGKRMPKSVVAFIACGAVLLAFIFAVGAVYPVGASGSRASFAHGESV